MSQTHAATLPPGRVTRFISAAAAAGSETKWKTSCATPGRSAVLERERLGGADAEVGAGHAGAALLDERLGRIDARDVFRADDARKHGGQRAGAAADVEDPLARGDARGARRTRARAGRCSGP